MNPRHRRAAATLALAAAAGTLAASPQPAPAHQQAGRYWSTPPASTYDTAEVPLTPAPQALPEHRATADLTGGTEAVLDHAAGGEW